MKISSLAISIAFFFSATLTAFAEGRNPNDVFDTYCFSCHGTGWDGAPVIGDSFAWEERKAKGMDALLQNTIEGFNAMPPKGSCGDCTEAELKAVIEMLIAE